MLSTSMFQKKIYVCMQVRVSVTVGRAEVELSSHLDGKDAGATPLARFAIADVWVAFRNTPSGGMSVSLSLPRVEVGALLSCMAP